MTVVVTAYNIERYIERALSSVLDQGLDGVEIIVVDDGSSDSTLERAATILKGEPNAQLIAQANAGPGAARNVGIAAARGEFVLFLDGDDWLSPGSLAALHAESEGVDMVLSNRRRYWERTGRYVRNIVFSDKRGVSPSDAPEIMSIMAVHGKLFRRALLVDNDVEFPTHMSSEDFVFTYRAYAHVTTVSTISAVTYNYRKRDDVRNRSLTQERLSEFNLTSRLRQIELTLDVVESSRLRQMFPDTNFLRIDYDTRLMRHVAAIPDETDVARRDAALGQIRAFLEKHEDAALGSVRGTTRPIYQAILDGNYDLAAERTREKLAKDKQTKTKGAAS